MERYGKIFVEMGEMLKAVKDYQNPQRGKWGCLDGGLIPTSACFSPRLRITISTLFFKTLMS